MHIDSFGLFGCALGAFLKSKKLRHFILRTQFCKLFEPTSLKNLSNSSRSDSEISFWWRSWNLWAKTSTTVMAQVWKQFYPVYLYHKVTLVKTILSRFLASGKTFMSVAATPVMPWFRYFWRGVITFNNIPSLSWVSVPNFIIQASSLCSAWPILPHNLHSGGKCNGPWLKGSSFSEIVDVRTILMGKGQFFLLSTQHQFFAHQIIMTFYWHSCYFRLLGYSFYVTYQ